MGVAIFEDVAGRFKPVGYVFYVNIANKTQTINVRFMFFRDIPEEIFEFLDVTEDIQIKRSQLIKNMEKHLRCRRLEIDLICDYSFLLEYQSSFTYIIKKKNGQDNLTFCVPRQKQSHMRFLFQLELLSAIPLY